MSNWRIFLYRSFIAPFVVRSRLLLYIASFLGCFGFTGATIYLAFDLAELGMMPIMSFFATRFTVTGFIVMPLAFYALYKFPIKYTSRFMLLMQLGVMAFILYQPETLSGTTPVQTAQIAVLFAMMAVPFWSMFHLNMLCHTSDDNLGNEVSVSGLVNFAGGTLATLSSGIALTYFHGPVFVTICFAALTISLILMSFIPRQSQVNAVREGKDFSLPQALRRNKELSMATVQEGIFHFFTSFSTPIWLWAIGVKSMMMGILLSVQGATKFIVSPIAGHLFHENKSREIMIGAALKPLGWIPWIIIQAPWVMLISSFIWSLSSHLYSVGMGSRWYSQRCLATQAAREMALAMGRLLCAITAVPILYLGGPQLFFIIALIVTCGIILSSLWVRHSEAG